MGESWAQGILVCTANAFRLFAVMSIDFLQQLKVNLLQETVPACSLSGLSDDYITLQHMHTTKQRKHIRHCQWCLWSFVCLQSVSCSMLFSISMVFMTLLIANNNGV